MIFKEHPVLLAWSLIVVLAILVYIVKINLAERKRRSRLTAEERTVEDEKTTEELRRWQP